MDAEERRGQIITLLKDSSKPISGTELAKRLSVSRQVIVQDIALLRAGNKNILSTNKGYLLYDDHAPEKTYRRTVRVRHTNDQILDELYTIVDYGGRVRDVVCLLYTSPPYPLFGRARPEESADDRVQYRG